MDTVSMLNKMSFYCQPILPLVYDESMSYYETLCKVVGQLNTTGETVNKLNEGLTGEIADRQAADAALDERLKLVEATNAKIHFLVFDGANPNGGFPTRSELYQWVHEGDAIFTLFRTNEEGRGQIYAASCSYNAGNWGSEASNDFSIIVPIETSYDATQDYAVKQKVAKLSIPLSPQTNLNVAWRLQIIEINTPSTSAEGVVNLVAVINDSDSVNCSITPSEFLGLYNMTRGGKNLCVAVNAKLSYDGLARSSSVATVDTTNRKIRIAFERDHGTFIENGVKQLNKTLDYIVGDANTNVWTHETIDSKTLDFSRYDGFQFTRGAHNVITANDESTPNAVYAQYHSDTSGKLYQNLPVRLVDTVDNAEYWNGVFDIKDDRHMTFTFVTSNYVTASGKMLVRVIELSADVDTTAWKYAEKEFELPISSSGEKYLVESTAISAGEYDAARKKTDYYLTFNKTNNEIIAALNSGKDIQFKVTLTEGNDSYTAYFSVGYTRVDVFSNVPAYMFVGSFGDLDHSVITVYGVTDSDETFRPYLTTTGGILPEPNPDDSDDGKVLAVSNHKWEMKTPSAGSPDAVLYTPQTLTDEQKKQARENIDAEEQFVVNATIGSDGAVLDKTFAQIQAAIQESKQPVLKISVRGVDSIFIPLVSASTTMIVFAGITDISYSGNTTISITTTYNGEVIVGNSISPVINSDGNMLQVLMASDPTEAMQIATKKYVDDHSVTVDTAMSDTSTNPVQNKAITAALASVVRETIYPITVTATSADWTVTNGIAYKEATADRTFDNIKAAYNANKTPVCEFERMMYSLVLTSTSAFIFASYRGAVSNDTQYTGIGKYPTSLITINTTGVVISRTAGDLPAVDGTDNGKMLIVSGGEWALQSVAGTTVDADLSTTSENPVQNKTVTAALNDKLPKTGGTVTGALRTNDSFSAGGTIAFGEAPIGLSQTADGAAEIRYGSAGVDDNPPPLSRLKVARPTADDDAATKAYVDGKSVAPILTSPVMIRKEGTTDSAGVYLSTIGTGEKQAEIRFEDVNENSPVAIANLRTPTGAGSDDYAATKGYVDGKVASSGAPITIKLGTGNAATSTATFAEIKAALEAGKAPIMDSAPGTSHWFALNWTLSGSDRLSIQYGTFNVEGGGMANFTLYNVSVSSTGITYSSSQFTTE